MGKYFVADKFKMMAEQQYYEDIIWYNKENYTKKELDNEISFLRPSKNGKELIAIFRYINKVAAECNCESVEQYQALLKQLQKSSFKLNIDEFESKNERERIINYVKGEDKSYLREMNSELLGAGAGGIAGAALGAYMARRKNSRFERKKTRRNRLLKYVGAGGVAGGVAGGIAGSVYQKYAGSKRRLNEPDTTHKVDPLKFKKEEIYPWVKPDLNTPEKTENGVSFVPKDYYNTVKTLVKKSFKTLLRAVEVAGKGNSQTAMAMIKKVEGEIAEIKEKMNKKYFWFEKGRVNSLNAIKYTIHSNYFYALEQLTSTMLTSLGKKLMVNIEGREEQWKLTYRVVQLLERYFLKEFDYVVNCYTEYIKEHPEMDVSDSMLLPELKVKLCYNELANFEMYISAILRRLTSDVKPARTIFFTIEEIWDKRLFFDVAGADFPKCV